MVLKFMFKKKKTYVILVLIIAIAGGIYYYKSKKPIVNYTAQQAEKGNLMRTVSVTGEVIAPVEADLSFELSGQVESLSVDLGDRVKVGQKIATIGKGTLLAQLAQAQQNAMVQKQMLTSMERKGAAYSHFDKEAQMAQIAAAQAAVAQIQTEIGETTLYSPIAGTIIKKNVEVGETTVANAVTSNTAVVTVASDGDLQTQVQVPESDVVDVKIGQHAKVSLDALPANDKLDAEVFEIDPSSTVIQDVIYYNVKLKFEKPDSRVRIGMSTNVDINTAEHDNVVMVPARAVKNDNGQSYVEILNADGQTTRKVNVQTGLVGDDGMTEVTSGLSGGENVVVLAM